MNNITKEEFISELIKIKNIENKKYDEKVEKIRELLINSIYYKNLPNIFKSNFNFFKQDITYITKYFSYSIIKFNEQINPIYIVGFEHGSYNSDVIPFSMICNAKRIRSNLISLSENPNYYFNGEGIDDDISYICYIKKDNEKFYTITSGAHRSTIAIILNQIFYGENLIRINKVNITERQINYSLAEVLEKVEEIVSKNKNLIFEVTRDNFYNSEDIDISYSFRPINQIKLIKKDTYETLFLREYNNTLTANSAQIIIAIAENEKKIIESIKIELLKILNNYDNYEEREIKKFKCEEFFRYICKIFS